MRYCSVQIQHGESVRRGYSSSHEKAKAPKYNNASITGQPTCSYDMYGKNDLALQHFFFSSSRQLLRFDFNAFFFLCSFVFSCKNLTVLECLYFIKCVLIFFFLLLYPRIAVIILMSQYLTSFCERDQRQERKTLNTFSSNVDSFTLAIQKN